MLHYINFEGQIVLVEIFLEVLIAHLIEVLKLAEIIRLFLYCVVCQVNILIIQIMQVEFSRTRPYVAILIKVALEILINAGEEAEDSEVKLPPVDQ